MYAPDLFRDEDGFSKNRKRMDTQYAPDLFPKSNDSDPQRTRTRTQYAPDLFSLDPEERRKRQRTIYAPDLFTNDSKNKNHIPNKSIYGKDFERLWGESNKNRKYKSIDQIGEGLEPWELERIQNQNNPRSKQSSLNDQRSITDQDFYNMMFGYPHERNQNQQNQISNRKPARSMYENDWKRLEHGWDPTQKEKELIASRYFGDFMKMINENGGPKNNRISMHPSMLKFMDENPEWASQMINNWRQSMIDQKNNLENTNKDQEKNNNDNINSSKNSNHLNPNQQNQNQNNKESQVKFPRTMSFSNRDEENNQWENSGSNEEDLDNLMSKLQSQQNDKGNSTDRNVFKDKDSGIKNQKDQNNSNIGRIRNNTAITPTQPIFNLSGVEDLGNSRANSTTGKMKI